VPLLRGTDQAALGVLIFQRDQPVPFSEADIALAQSFADQAVIALENVRLFNETKEALERQTATAEVLQVISNSMADAQPVFERILDSCQTLFGTVDMGVCLVSGSEIGFPAYRGRFAHAVRNEYPRPLAGSVSEAVMRGGEVVHIPDASADDVPAYVSGLVAHYSNFSLATAPMLWQGQGIGTIDIARTPPRPFNDKELGLLKTFADQAVIAIQNARLFNSTEAALQRQTASADILRVISQSPTDAQPVFAAVVNAAVKLLSSDLASMIRCDGATHSPVARATPQGPVTGGLPQALPLDPAANLPSRAIVGQSTLHVPDWDAIELPEHEQGIRAQFGIRASLMLPLLTDGDCIGVLAFGRQRVGPYNEQEIALAEAFRDQALIAIRNARLFNETQEALEQQTATAEVLKVIAQSPDDVQPVFDTIVRLARELGGSFGAWAFLFDGQLIRPVAQCGTMVDQFKNFMAQDPWPATRATISGRVLLEQRAIVIEDLKQDPEWVERLPNNPSRRVIGVPLMRDGKATGCLNLAWPEPGPVPERLKQLLQTFADQAVIAIENVRLFNETKEALERQTATAEVLQVISGSVADAQPVFEAIVDSCTRLFRSEGGALGLVDEHGMLHLHAFRVSAATRQRLGDAATAAASAQLLARFPRPVAGTLTERAIQQGRVVEVNDMVGSAEAAQPGVQAAGVFNMSHMVTAPLVWNGQGIGSLNLMLADGAGLTERERQLLQTFADQAVIAIQNARLFNETQDALARQTATSDVLQVISESPTDVQPVFDIIAERAATLTQSRFGLVIRVDGEALNLASMHGSDPAAVALARQAWPQRLDKSTSVSARAIRERRVINVADVQDMADGQYSPEMQRVLAVAGWQSILCAPLMRDQDAIGTLCVGRAEAGLFADKEVALLQTFARQAVVAIENVRLFNETKEALEQQKASSDVLEVISQSMGDSAPVFEAILERCERLIDGTLGTTIQLPGDDGFLHRRHFRFTEAGKQLLFSSAAEAEEAAQRMRALPAIPLPDRYAQANAGVFVYPDVLNGPGVPQSAREFCRAGTGGRMSYSAAGAPMFKDGRYLGTISVARARLGDFDVRERSLLEMFARQAVVALENARLFRETQEALERQTATAEALRVISRSVADTQPVFAHILESVERLIDIRHASIVLAHGDGLLHVADVRGPDLEMVRSLRAVRLDVPSVSSQAFAERRQVFVADVEHLYDATHPIRSTIDAWGSYGIVSTPLIWENQALGLLNVTRQAPPASARVS
jgi:GAF domain-containing protein